MSNRVNSEHPWVIARRSRACLLLCLATGILVPTLVFAQPISMEAKSALHSVQPGEILVVVANEAGDTEEASLVTIEIRDAANVVRASVSHRNLVLGKPVFLSATGTAGRAEQFRAVVTFTIQSTPEIH